MLTVQVADLLTAARLKGDQADSTWLTDSALLSLVNDAYHQLYTLVCSTDWGSRRFSASATSTLVSGQSEYALPSDLWRLEGVDIKLSGGVWQALPRSSLHERWVQLPLPGVYLYTYRVQGDYLVFEPTPTGSTEYRVLYIPDPAVLTAGGTVRLEPSWREWVELQAAAAALSREEAYEQAQLLSTRAAALWSTIYSANTRVSGDPEHIPDIGEADL